MEGAEAVAAAAVAVPDIAGVQVMVEGECTLVSFSTLFTDYCYYLLLLVHMPLLYYSLYIKVPSHFNFFCFILISDQTYT